MTHLGAERFSRKDIKAEIPEEPTKIMVTLCNANRNKTGEGISAMLEGLAMRRTTFTSYIEEKREKEPKLQLSTEKKLA